jgi:hypothetical protein
VNLGIKEETKVKSFTKAEVYSYSCTVWKVYVPTRGVGTVYGLAPVWLTGFAPVKVY